MLQLISSNVFVRRLPVACATALTCLLLFKSNPAHSTLSQKKNCSDSKALRLIYPNNHYVRLVVYSKLADFSQNDKLVLIVPPTGGSSIIEKRYAKYFCNHGLNAVIIDDWTGANLTSETLDFTVHQRELEYAESAIKKTLSYFKNSTIGMLATSKGAIGISAFTDTIEKKVSVLISIVAGGPLHLAISRANEEGLKTLRSQRMKLLDIDQMEYDQLIFENLKYRTQDISPNSKMKVVLVYATEDIVVPTELQVWLKDLWNPSALWYLEDNHVPAIGKTVKHLKDDFLHIFKDQL